MNEQEIREQYVQLYGLPSDATKSTSLQDLRNCAEKAGLNAWGTLIDARLALVEHDHASAERLSTTLLDQSELSTDLRCWVLLNRGVAYGRLVPPNTEKQIADYTAVINMSDAPAEQKARALVNRSLTYGRLDPPERGKKIVDCTAVIDMRDAPTKEKARARVHRGWTYGQLDSPERENEIADYTAVIDMRDAPAKQKAMALLNRSLQYDQFDPPEREKTIAICTNVIGIPDAPAFLKEWARRQKSLIESLPPALAKVMSDQLVEFDEETREKFKEALQTAKAQKKEFFGESRFDPDASFLLIAREWNSFTPAVPEEGESSRGGGYFIKHLDTGIVIDPGFDFLEIFAEAGGRMCDIDHIVITHAHNDHTAELETILTLLHEYNEEEPKKVTLHFSQGAARKFSGLLPLQGDKRVAEHVTLNRGKTKHPQVVHLSDWIKLTVLPAYHDDVVTRDYAVGLGFEFSFEDSPSRRLVFTSDTGVLPPGDESKPIHKMYPEPFCEAGADLVILHIGSIQEIELEGSIAVIRPGAELSLEPKIDLYPMHLGALGTIWILCDLQPKAAIVSEFGEEMRDIWIKAVRAIGAKVNEVLKGQEKPEVPVFAGDPVVLYDIRDGQFLCHDDLVFHDANELEMRGVHEMREPRGQVQPARPYLFLKGSQPVDQSDTEDKVIAFHKGQKERTLPHFRKPDKEK